VDTLDTGSLMVVVHWHQTKVIRRLNANGVEACNGTFRIVDEFSEEFLAITVENNETCLPFRLPRLAPTIALIKSKLNMSADEIREIFWFEKGSIEALNGGIIYLYGHLLFKLVDKSRFQKQERIDYIQSYLTEINSKNYFEAHLHRTRQINTDDLALPDWSFKPDFRIKTEILGSAGTRKNLARVLDLTFLDAVPERFLSGEISQKEVANELYGRMRDEELAQKTISEKRERRSMLLLNTSRFEASLKGTANQSPLQIAAARHRRRFLEQKEVFHRISSSKYQKYMHRPLEKYFVSPKKF